MKARVRKVYSWWSCQGIIAGHTVCGTGDTPLEAITKFVSCAQSRGFI